LKDRLFNNVSIGQSAIENKEVLPPSMSQAMSEMVAVEAPSV